MDNQEIEVVQDNFEANGKLVRASFLFIDGGRVTECILHDYRHAYVGMPMPASGTAVRKPSDAPNRATGMRYAMRRACDCANVSYKVGNKIYQAYRKHLHDAEKPAHFVIYNHEVRKVTDAQHAAWTAIVREELGVCGCGMNNGFNCTRGSGHTGAHISSGGNGIYHVWDDGVELSYDEWEKLLHEMLEREAKK